MVVAASRAVAVGPTGLQVEAWRLLWEEVLRDPESLAECRDWEASRRHVRPQMLELLQRYRSGGLDPEALRATFDRRARTDWNAFGLSGLSGVVFLNRLVKHVPDRSTLAAQLRALLPVPHDVEDARGRLRKFIDFLERFTRVGRVSAARLQPARTAFFASVWWNLQDTEQWPSFQPSARSALRREQSMYTPTGDTVADYLAFRDAYLRLASALKLTTWELEYLCWWRSRRDEREDADDEPERSVERRFERERAVRVARVREPAPEKPGRARARPAIDHTQIQWLLAKIGRRLGCRVWIAVNDRAKRWNDEPLAALSARRLPSLGLTSSSQRIVSLIDVVWLKGANQVAAAFEVEHTSSIYSGLLRMADLATLSPNLSFPLYIVAPRERLDKVRRELARPTFQKLKLHRRCAFFSSEALLDAADSIMRWADDPAAIERLAMRAEDVPLDDG